MILSLVGLAVPDLLIFECASGIELHEEIKW